jgi:hypothetical protein
MAEHRQVHVKVNAFVDEGVRPLVEALNSTDSVITWDSCECDSDGLATLCLNYGQLGKTITCKLVLFVDRLRKVLDRSECAHVQITIEWAGVGLTPHAVLTIPPYEIESATKAIYSEREWLSNIFCTQLTCS